MIDWSVGDLATTLGITKENVRLVSPFISGGFGGKLFIRADALLAALGARAAGRPVKVALTRPMMFNNTVHRPDPPAPRSSILEELTRASNDARRGLYARACPKLPVRCAVQEIFAWVERRFASRGLTAGRDFA